MPLRPSKSGLDGQIIDGASAEIERCPAGSVQQWSAGWVAVVDLPAQGDDHDGGCAGLLSLACPLLKRLRQVPDPRRARGRRHPLVVILVLTACATLVVGNDSVRAIWQWAARTPQHVLHRIEARFDAWRGRYTIPSERTFRRVLADLDGDALDQALGGYAADVTRGHAPTPVIPASPGPAEREQRRAVTRAVTHPAPAGLLPAAAIDGNLLHGTVTPAGRRGGVPFDLAEQSLTAGQVHEADVPAVHGGAPCPAALLVEHPAWLAAARSRPVIRAPGGTWATDSVNVLRVQVGVSQRQRRLRQRSQQTRPATGRSRGRVVTHSFIRTARTPHLGQQRACSSAVARCTTGPPSATSSTATTASPARPSSGVVSLTMPVALLL
jgi:hypothetical protein